MSKEGTTKRRHDRRTEEKIKQNRLWLDLCLLCGVSLACNNKELRAQIKPHLVRSHADYLGSTWDGYGTYDSKLPIDGHLLVREADLISKGLLYLSHDLRARVMPASAVFTPK